MKFLVLFCIFLLGSCSQETKETHLKNGLIGYRKSRDINERFIKNFEVKKIGFFKLKNGTTQYTLLLNDKISATDIENFSLGVHVYPIHSQGKFLIWDEKPNLKLFGKNKYIIAEFRTPITNFDSIAYFLYDRDRYRKVIGNRIVLKNIAL